MDSTSDPPPELPDELLNIIIRYASFHPRSAVHYREVIPEIVERFLPPTKGIQSLSLASHRLRQISLPYLFASVMINESMDVSRLMDDCEANAQFARLITALVVDEVPDEELECLDELLSYLPHLEYIHLEHKTANDELLLVTLANHQNIKHILIPHFYDLPRPVEFVSAHLPSLRKIVFVGRSGGCFQQTREIGHSIPFAVLLNKKIKEQEKILGDPFWGNREYDLRKLGVSFGHGLDQNTQSGRSIQTNPDTWSRDYGYPQDSDVSELGFYVRNALHQLLAIAGPCFPNITILNLIFAVESMAHYDIDDFIASLREFPSLRQLELLNSYSHLQHREDATPGIVQGAGVEDAASVDMSEFSSPKLPVVGQLDFGFLSGLGPRRSRRSEKCFPRFILYLDKPEEENLAQFLTTTVILSHTLAISGFRYASFHPRSAVHYREVIPEIVEKFLPPTKGIQSLSLASHRFRQISLPYLFASVRIKDSMGVSRLVDDCVANAQLACSITALDVCGVPAKGPVTYGLYESLSRHLPHLEYVRLPERGIARFQNPLVFAVGSHPNIKHILIPSFFYVKSSEFPVTVDTSKILLAGPVKFTEYYDINGMASHPLNIEIARIVLDNVPKLYHPRTNEFMIIPQGWTSYRGLQELSIEMSSLWFIMPMPWIPEFVSAHLPGLRKIVFTLIREQEQIHGLYWGNARSFDLNRVGVSLGHGFASDQDSKLERSSQPDLEVWSRQQGYPQDSDVTELAFHVWKCLQQLLEISGQSFRNLKVLNLTLYGHGRPGGRDNHDIDDFIINLRQIPSLRQLELINAFNCLKHREEPAMPWLYEDSIWDADWVVEHVRSGETPSVSRACSGMIWYMSRIAKGISSIELFYISESDRSRFSAWNASIWLVGSELRGY
ncbi:hypothetical protein EV360DRAFT_68435 [Lentinula raphanica]|nr:hypothetical protein EV360DRAFT_68435 [Lentinula raphanica]